MHEPSISDSELRELMAYHFKQALQTELIKGTLPPQLKRAIAESPDAVVESLVDLLAPATAARMEGQKAAQHPPKPLSNEDLRVLLLALSSIKASYGNNVDVDMDGAVLFCNRGLKMLRTERYADAKRHFLRALDIKDNLKSAWEGLAKAQEGLGETEKAAESRRRAAQL
ncbi:MAG TPA: hypothetical protein V6D17_24230 [Candidatus Obscuribacterales bacterium]